MIFSYSFFYKFTSTQKIHPKKLWKPSMTAICKAIKVNDCPCVMALSKVYFTHLLFEQNQHYWSLFEYSYKMFSDECALFLLEAGGGIEQVFSSGSIEALE